MAALLALGPPLPWQGLPVVWSTQPLPNSLPQTKPERADHTLCVMFLLVQELLSGLASASGNSELRQWRKVVNSDFRTWKAVGRLASSHQKKRLWVKNTTAHLRQQPSSQSLPLNRMEQYRPSLQHSYLLEVKPERLVCFDYLKSWAGKSGESCLVNTEAEEQMP